MKLKSVKLRGFRGYRDEVRFDFASGFTVIDGRNGVGKSTIFDAIEFVLTGRISKYGDAKAAGEGVGHYLWWTGYGSAMLDGFAEVSFEQDEKIFTLRRSVLEEPSPSDLELIEESFVDQDQAPKDALRQLCAASIIRDEHIAGLSLDLSETDRYAMLRQAIGANDADEWIARANRLVTAAKKRLDSAKSDINDASQQVSNLERRADEIRLSLAGDQAISEAASRIGQQLNSADPPDILLARARELLAAREGQVEALSRFQQQAATMAGVAEEIESLEGRELALESELVKAEAYLASLPPLGVAQSTQLSSKARELVHLITLGQRMGLVQSSCPVCGEIHTAESFSAGATRMTRLASEIDAEASDLVKAEEERSTAASAVDRLRSELSGITSRFKVLADQRSAYDASRSNLDLPPDDAAAAAADRRRDLINSLEGLHRDIRILSTLRQDGELDTVLGRLQSAKDNLARAQERAGRSRRAEATAAALFDAARRAGAETLDRRLDRVLPLMSELYQRLRPHHHWRDIEYAIRGDVRRFLSLRVGDGLNPQFLFSSGQRRATGLAFLLSINLSLAWSRWRTILLDDPVQHVDDFRTVHLAELLAQLVSGGRQIIVAVEDAALADMLCRRLPIAGENTARRMTIGNSSEGAFAIISEETLKPLPQTVFRGGGITSGSAQVS
ncbi:AAA family ATPase (plasmid) [Rhizobium ruizarguesonis]|uniref:AAA family ATPase n=1 Tax=Rhizobium ruizarguesonis TaxID=2081791 RepID=UPI001A99C7E3|nr:AAA family ATPase [Rhizobium ruizarguesonis]QSZ05108.1 AAA family ATPase [Rhizobium ruizarguesonis]